MVNMSSPNSPSKTQESKLPKLLLTNVSSIDFLSIDTRKYVEFRPSKSRKSSKLAAKTPNPSQ